MVLPQKLAMQVPCKAYKKGAWHCVVCLWQEINPLET